MTSITRRFSARSVITVGYFLIGAGMALAAFASTVPMFFVVMTVFTIGEIISMPMVPTYLARVAPADRRGRYMGIFGLTWALALLLGPKIGLAIYESNPVEWWYLCGVFGVLAALLMYFNPVGSKDRE